MPRSFDLAAVQETLRSDGLDGWLFYDFRGLDPIAGKVLGLDPRAHATRRWYYLVPAQGEPRKLVHAIEPAVLDALPGRALTYLSWRSLEDGLKALLDGVRTVAMQYSPAGEVPYVSRVDGGTLEAVRRAGPRVVTSADLVQRFDAVLDEEQAASHRRAATALREVVDGAFQRVGEALGGGRTITEAELLGWVEAQLAERGLVRDHPPIVAVDAHAADPHFEVAESGSAAIGPGSLLLLDVWAKEDRQGSVFADITWCAWVGGAPPEEVARVFDVVRAARDAAIARADSAFRRGEDIRGFELDRAAREVIDEAGYGERFIHRLGHSIHEETHGNGANLDDLETHDTRRVLPGALFSVEPGIYLPGRFGIRSEVDVLHTGSGAEVTGRPIQERLVQIEA